MSILNKKRETKNLPGETTQAILKWHTCILICCAFAAYYFSIHSYSSLSLYAAKHPNYNLQNLGIFFIFLEAAFAYSMNALQGSAYWLPWLRFRKANLDERQQLVRRRVYEQAFVVTITALFTVIPIVFSMLAKYNQLAQNDLFAKFSLIAGIFLVSLPASLASWQEDS